MTTRSTIIEGKITGNSREFTQETVRATNAAKRMQREAEKAAKAQQAAQQKLGQESTKAGNAIAGATSAVQTFGAAGEKSVTGLAKSLASVGSLVGPQGAIISGAALAGIALLEMLIKPRREAEALAASLGEVLRQLRKGQDARGSFAIASNIAFGNPDADPIVDGEDDLSKRANDIIKSGGLLKARAELAKAERELRDFEALVEDVSGAGEDSGAGDAALAARRKNVDELRGAIDLLAKTQEQATSQGIRFQNAGLADAERAAKAKAIEEARAKAMRDGATATNQLETALQSLEARLDTLAVKGDGPAALALQLDTLFEKVKKGGASTEVLDTLRARIDALVRSASQAELENVSRALEDFVTESTLTLVDDLAVAGQRATESIADLIDTATNAGDFALASQLIEQRDAAVAANTALREMTATLERLDAARKAAANTGAANVIGLGGINIGSLNAVLVEAAALRDITLELENQNLSATDRVRLEERREEITRKIFEANQRNANLEAEQAAQQQSTLDAAREYLNVLTAAAAAIGGINSDLVRGLSGVGSVIDGLQDLAAAAKAVNGFGNLFKSGAGALSAAGPIGAIVGGFSVIADAVGLFGTKAKERAAELARRAEEFNRGLDAFAKRALQLNRVESAIEEIEKTRDELIALAGAGTQKAFVAVQAFLANLVRIKDDFLDTLNLDFLNATGQSMLADVAAAQDKYNDTLRSLDALLKNETLSQEEYAEALFKAGVILSSTLSDIEASAAAAAEAGIRNEVLTTLDNDLAVNGLEGAAALEAIVAAVARLSPELAALTDGLDLSTADGLRAFRTQLRDFYNALAADGIVELEGPIVALIQRLLGGIEGALGALPETLDPILAALEAFDVRARVFGLSIGERIAGLAPLLAQQFGAIGEALDGIDLSSSDGLGTFKDRLLGVVDGFLADGEIDAVERPIVDAIETILGLIGTAADEAANAAAQAAADAESARSTRVTSATSSANAAIALGDLDGADALQVRIEALAALSPALAELLSLDLTTLDGLDRAKGILRDVFAQIEDGSISAEMLGDLLGPELRDIILDLDGDFDGLIESVLAVGDAARDASAELQDFAAEVGRDFLRSAGMGLEAELAEIDDRIAKRIAKARSLGASDETIQQLVSIGQSERAAAIQRAADAAAREAEAVARASQQAAAQRSPSQSVTTRSVQSITEVTGQVVAGYLRTIARDTKSIDTSLNALLARGLSGAAPLITPPALPSAFAARSSSTTSAAGGMQVVIGDITVTVHGAVAGSSPTAIGQEIGRATLLQISSGLGQLARMQDGGNRR